MTTGRRFAVALLACLVAAVFGAEPLAAWVDGSVVAGTIVQDAADTWLGTMQSIGLTRPYDIVRDAVRGAQGQ